MSETARRLDAGKLRYDLIPHEWEEEIARVLTLGAQKYEDNNWKKSVGTPESQKWRDRCFASLRRHLAAHRSGEILDPEMGTHHMAHVAWNALVIMYYDMREQAKP